MADNNPGSLSDKDIQEEVDTFMFEVSINSKLKCK